MSARQWGVSHPQAPHDETDRTRSGGCGVSSSRQDGIRTDDAGPGSVTNRRVIDHVDVEANFGTRATMFTTSSATIAA